MRCFIGLDLSATEKLALDSWRQQALPEVMPRSKLTASSAKSKRGDTKAQNGTKHGAAQPYAVPPKQTFILRCVFWAK